RASLWNLGLGMLLGLGTWDLELFLSKLLLKFFHLGPNNGPAVSFVRVAPIIILMIPFGFVKLRQRHDLGDDWTAEPLLCFGFGFLRGRFLGWAVVKND